MKNLLIIGAGGHGRVVKETAELLNVYNKIDFLDDNFEYAIGQIDDYLKYKDIYSHAFVAIGNSNIRAKMIEELSKFFLIPSIIHPTAFISKSSKIENGSFIGAQATINTNVIINDGVIIGIGSLIDHDSILESFSYVNAGGIVPSNKIVVSHYHLYPGNVYTG